MKTGVIIRLERAVTQDRRFSVMQKHNVKCTKEMQIMVFLCAYKLSFYILQKGRKMEFQVMPAEIFQ